ncbi:hypothetical protein [Nonomuraea sp. NPDC002799]
MTAWDEIRRLIDAGDADDLVDRLIALDPGERKAVAAELREHIPVLRDHADSQQSRWADDDWVDLPTQPWERWREQLRLTGAGTLGPVTAVVSWLNRRDLLILRRYEPEGGFGEPAPMIRLLGHRPAAWQADLAVRLATRLRPPRDPGTPLALALLRHTGVEPPQHDPLVVAWVTSGTATHADPLWPALLPRFFEAEGVGRVLQHERVTHSTGWLTALDTWGDRQLLLDGCMRRFLRGGTAQDLRFFVRLHEVLEPSDAEVVPYLRDYLRLLPSAPGPVAQLALDHLRRIVVPDSDVADLADALSGLLFRAEVKLVRAGLSWFDEIVRRSPALADDLAPALVMAFGHDSYAVQGRAAQLALKHRFGDLGTKHIRAALPTLPPALATRLTKGLQR